MSDRSHIFRDIVLGVVVMVVGAAVLAFANIPTRVSLVEQSQTGIEKKIDHMDGKLDKLLERRGR